MKAEYKKVVKLSEDDLLNACAAACARMMLERPATLLIADELHILSAYIMREVFKEEN